MTELVLFKTAEAQELLLQTKPYGTTVKFLNLRTPKKLCCNLPKIQTKRPNLRVFNQKDVNGIANSEDCTVCPDLYVENLGSIRY